ncbi:unnamed protein product [Prunus armeniaca]
MKHIELDFQVVRDRVNRGLLQVFHVSTHDQLVDVLTKPLPCPQFQLLWSKIDVSEGATVLRERKRDTPQSTTSPPSSSEVNHFNQA